jgi:hypothetical protein
MIRKKMPMSKEGYNNWGHPAQAKISKSKLIWKHYANPPMIYQDPDEPFQKNGKPNLTVPVEHLATDRAIAEFIFDNFHVDDGDILAIQQFSHGKTKTHVAFSPHIAEIHILSVENRKADVIGTGSLNKRWFRREETKRKRGMRQ